MKTRAPTKEDRIAYAELRQHDSNWFSAIELEWCILNSSSKEYIGHCRQKQNRHYVAWRKTLEKAGFTTTAQGLRVILKDAKK